MDWNRSNVIGLALASCTVCEGHGMVKLTRWGGERPCDCVYRAIFRACYRSFRDCAIYGALGSSVSVECTRGPSGRHSYSRKREEYAADFCLVTRRVLTEAEHQLFRFAFLLGADSKLCAARLGLDRGAYFHLLYKLEAKLGYEYAELQPYPLYPVDEYFGGQVRVKKIDMPQGEFHFRRDPFADLPMVPRRPLRDETWPYRPPAVPLTA